MKVRDLINICEARDPDGEVGVLAYEGRAAVAYEADIWLDDKVLILTTGEHTIPVKETDQ